MRFYTLLTTLLLLFVFSGCNTKKDAENKIETDPADQFFTRFQDGSWLKRDSDYDDKVDDNPELRIDHVSDQSDTKGTLKSNIKIYYKNVLLLNPANVRHINDGSSTWEEPSVCGFYVTDNVYLLMIETSDRDYTTNPDRTLHYHSYDFWLADKSGIKKLPVTNEKNGNGIYSPVPIGEVKKNGDYLIFHGKSHALEGGKMIEVYSAFDYKKGKYSNFTRTVSGYNQPWVWEE